ncbi:CmpA/NrtA family ABC transporter substrate-binding protein [Paraburkholderia phymatum]|uniref:ABC nitrate transporter, periplasmic ligand binding protein n=1 Tax=Paraburkholderia phymatum (strain DSM 17167 / CIP 108236 / LMG 21445 / STM815) TaxID=391038 RepID=B2JLG6_PARP8|nr:CmpA/NrtA family ABC transporter substrate-binding protein [Paraburkholderia phymatum]ACC72599.1 ABC nitrate transporter, periplasmic ligand binding protein [Paraburkholderia phymatum STM815]
MNSTANTALSADSGKLEKSHLRLGFVALSDAAPLVAAKLLEFGHAHGLTIELLKQPSWAAIRDKLLSGDLDAAHSLYGLVYGVQLGLGGPQTDMAVLMVLNRNGQAITVSNRLAAALDEHKTLPAALATLGRKPVFAQTFPTGTHAMWLYYWLASQGVDPLRDIDSVVIPPPQMVDALARDRLDGLCVGEPWNAVAQERGVGRTIAYTSEVWPDHPEKVLASRRDFVTRYPNTARALVQTMLEACRWLDDDEHRVEIARRLAADEFLGVPAASIASRLVSAGCDETRRPVAFFADGAVNYPHPAEGVWFFAQYARWGMVHSRGDFARIANEVNQVQLYRQAAINVGVAVRDDAPSVQLIDGRRWDGNFDRAYLQGFSIKA